MSALAKLNGLPLEAATAEFHKACGSRRWATAMAGARPFASVEQLHEVSAREWAKLNDADYLEAFAAHPRIGGKSDSKWSKQEQAGAASAAQTTLERLKAQNDAYFDKHGFIFIVCATGKSADEMLALLEARLPNDRATEIRNAAAEQGKISVIRLNKWLAENT